VETSSYIPDDAEKQKFILFVTGMSVKSGNAIENFRKICESHLQGKFELEIVDISRDKEKAKMYQIIGIPTLIRTYPAPQRMILGDLSDTPKVLKVLNLE
jgi:circadian clock protein KaiB